MSLPAHFTPIKICGLTREQDVDAAVQAGVQAIGFVLYEPSPRCVNVARAAELARRLPAFVNPVLLTVNASEATLEAACAEVPGAWLQFHGDENPAFCQRVGQRLGRRWLRAARIPLDHDAPAFDLIKYASDYQHAHALLLDAHVEGYGGGGKAFNWSRLPTSVNAHLVLSSARLWNQPKASRMPRSSTILSPPFVLPISIPESQAPGGSFSTARLD